MGRDHIDALVAVEKVAGNSSVKKWDGKKSVDNNELKISEFKDSSSHNRRKSPYSCASALFLQKILDGFGDMQKK